LTTWRFVDELQNVYPLPPDPTEFFRRTGYIQNESCDFPEKQGFQTFVPENENENDGQTRKTS
jgi:hypothetical protein